MNLAQLSVPFLLAALPANASAARQEASAPTELHEAKLASPFIATGNWHLDTGTATDRAIAEKKLILAYFSRSDQPCPLCTTYENEVLNTEEFAELSTTIVPLLFIMSEGAKARRRFKETSQHLKVPKRRRLWPSWTLPER